MTEVNCQTVDVKIKGDSREGARWTFKVTGRGGRELPLTWEAPIDQSPKLTNKSVAIWPPTVSTEWHLYAIRSLGEKKSESGSWVLIDENGKTGDSIPKNDSENLSILQDSNKTNRPVALMLYDAADQPRGVFFLKLERNVTLDKSNNQSKARLGVDFGTSNTCLAYAQGDGNTPKTLIFSLKPKWLWGKPQEDTAGFVPYVWHGESFYSTVLLSPKNNRALSNTSGGQIKAADLFQVDIPVLHKGLGESLYITGLEQNWDAQSDLKWDVDNESKAWRAFFLSLSLLYAHAELLFTHNAKVTECVWTYPLAFSGSKATTFKSEADVVLTNIQKLCYEDASPSPVAGMINESEAIALYENTEGQGTNYVDVFIDIGGGSTDVAVYANQRFLVQDSVEVAGRAFFSFAEESVNPTHAKFTTQGAKNFRENLNRLLRGKATEFTLPKSRGQQSFAADMYNLGTYYSITIGNLPKTTADNQHSLEQGIRMIVQNRSISKRSYQTFRSLLFYRHLISYALLQACAAVLNDEALPTKFRLICSGNGWGLALFAGMFNGDNSIKDTVEREAAYLLEKIKESLRKKTGESDVAKLERINNLKVGPIKFLEDKAKIAVAHGAVKNRPNNENGGDGNNTNEVANDGGDGHDANTNGSSRKMVCYAGIKLDPVKVNGQDLGIDWLNQWSEEHLLPNTADPSAGIQKIELGRLSDDTNPCDSLLEVFVSTKNGWGDINSVIRKDSAYVRNNELDKSPVNQLLTRVLYPKGNPHFFLENMAKEKQCE
jgi:hypothetical protein